LDYWKKLLGVGIVVLIAIVLINFFPEQKQSFSVKNFSFASEVDEQFNYVPNSGKYTTGETLFFVLELEGMKVERESVSYSVNAKVENLVSGNFEETFSETLTDETLPIIDNKGNITVVGQIQVGSLIRTGFNNIILEIKDNFSDEKIEYKKSFTVEEWDYPTIN
jgi:hypothetical protein